MYIEYNGNKPDIHEEAYIAPNATVRGNVTIGKGTTVLYGAIVTDEGGAVNIGEHCVIMEQAVVRGTPKHATTIGDSVLIGPHSHLSGCTIESEIFIATGSAVFNGAHVKTGSEVRINGIVHVNTVLKAGSLVPIGWIAVGNPAKILPPNQHEQIWEVQKEQDFPGTVWGVDRNTSKGERTRLYAKALQRHREDKIIAPDHRPPFEKNKQ